MKADPKALHVAQEFEHEAPLISCRFDPSGKYVFATGEDRAVVRWTLDSEAEDRERLVMAGHESWVGCLAFSADGKTVLSGGYDDSVMWWSAAESGKPDTQPIRKIDAHKGWVRALAVSPDDKLLASAGNDRVVKLWSLADGKPLREMKGHQREVYSLAFHPSGKFLISGDLKGVVQQWDVATGKSVRTFDAAALNSYNTGQKVDYGGVRSLSFNADGSQLACGGLHKASNPLGAINEPLVLRFDWDSQKLLLSHTVEKVRGVAWRTLFHPADGFLVGCSGGSGGGYLIFWDGDSDSAFHNLKLKDTARDCDLHPDGIRIATAHHDKKLRISRMAPEQKA